MSQHSRFEGELEQVANEFSDAVEAVVEYLNCEGDWFSCLQRLKAATFIRKEAATRTKEKRMRGHQ